MKDIKIFIRCTFLIGLFFLQSCAESEQEHITVPTKSTLIYMVADNDLDNNSLENIKELERGMPIESEGSIFVFVDRSKRNNPSHPYLLKISRDTINQSITSTILQSYREQNTCNPDCLKQVINDVDLYCQSLNSTLSRLVLWSHGSGWLPTGTVSGSGKQNPVLFSFGLDEDKGDSQKGSEEMNITELSQALTGHHFDYLIMDACFMGTIETAYELKDHFDYMILSPSEILSTGFPYASIVCDLLSNEICVQSIADKFFTFYSNKNNGFRSATVSIVNCSLLTDLGQAMQDFYKGIHKKKMDKIDVSFHRISQYDRTGSNYFFDLIQFVKQECDDQACLKRIMDVWSKVLVSYQHTEMMFSTLDLSNTCGLSIYIPNNYDERTKIHSYYKELKWTKDSGASFLFD